MDEFHISIQAKNFEFGKNLKILLSLTILLSLISQSYLNSDVTCIINERIGKNMNTSKSSVGLRA